MNFRQDEKGSTVITAVVIVLLIFIILGTTFGIATHYQKRAIDEHARKQAYLNGISVVNVIASQIANGSENYLPLSGDAPQIIQQIDLPKGQTGEVTGQIVMDKDNHNMIYVQVVSVYSGQSEKVQLTMQKYRKKWYQKTYSKMGDELSYETE